MTKPLKAAALLLTLAVPTTFAALPAEITIGTDATYAPFSSKNSSGQFVGFDIDLGNAMCARMAVKCRWVGSDFDALIPSLKAKKIDAIISSLSITAKREQEIAFSHKLYAADSRLIAVQGSTLTPDLTVLKGKHIGVLQGSTQEAYANAEWRPHGVDVVAYQNQDLIYADLAAGRLDGALQDEVAASEGFLKQPAGKGFAFAGPTVKDKRYFGEGTGVGLRKQDVALKAAFDKALAALRADGSYQKMAQKYFNFNIYGE